MVSVNDRKQLLEKTCSREGDEKGERSSRFNLFMSAFTKRASREEIKEAIRVGKKTHGAFVKLSTGKRTPPSSPTVFSFVVPASSVKQAVHRHFVKRRARHIIRKHKKILSKGYVGVFLFKKEVLGASFSEMEKEMLTLLKKSSVTH